MVDIIKELYDKAGVPLKCRPHYSLLSESQQLQILQVLIRGRWIEFAQYVGELGIPKYYVGKIDFKSYYKADSFREALAGLTVRIWENMSETDKNKIREALRGKKS